MQINSQIKVLRCSLNLSQERFGKKLGISGKSISAYETGRCVPTLRVVKQMAKEFNADFTEMSNESKTFLDKKMEELEESLTQLKVALTKLMSTEQMV